MPWWGWVLLILWGAISAVCAVWWGLALANADVQDEARQVAEDAAERGGSAARR